jgi:hypothetical protein
MRKVCRTRSVHPKIASEMLGHSSIAITLDLYSHVTPTMQREAVDALDAIFAPSSCCRSAVVGLPARASYTRNRAEGVGFEPTESLHPQRFSRWTQRLHGDA